MDINNNIKEFASSPKFIDKCGYMKVHGFSQQSSHQNNSSLTDTHSENNSATTNSPSQQLADCTQYYFVLKGNLLFMFEQKMKNLLGMMLLENHKIQPSSNGDLEFVLGFPVDSQSYRFECSSEKDASSWKMAFENASLAKTRFVLKKLYDSIKKNSSRSIPKSGSGSPAMSPQIQDAEIVCENQKENIRPPPVTKIDSATLTDFSIVDCFHDPTIQCPPPIAVAKEREDLDTNGKSNGQRNSSSTSFSESPPPLDSALFSNDTSPPIQNVTLDNDTLVVFSCKISENFGKILSNTVSKSKSSWSFLGSSNGGMNSCSGIRVVTKSRVHDAEWVTMHSTEWAEFNTAIEFIEFFVPLRICSNSTTNFRFELYVLNLGMIALVECNSYQLFHSIITNNLFIINLFNEETQLLVAELHLSLLKSKSKPALPYSDDKSDTVLIPLSTAGETFTRNPLLEQVYIVPSFDHSYLTLYESFMISNVLNTQVPIGLAKFLADYESQNLRSIVEMNFDDLVNCESLNSIQQRLIASHRELIKYYQSVVNISDSEKLPIFRKSSQKKNTSLEWFPINCGLHKFMVRTSCNGPIANYDELDIVTFGAPAAHGFGFQSSSGHQKEFSLDSRRSTTVIDYRYLDGIHHELTKSQVEINCMFQDLFTCLEGILDLPNHSDSLTDGLLNFQVLCTSIVQQTQATLQICWSMITAPTFSKQKSAQDSFSDLEGKLDRIRNRISATLLPKFSNNCGKFVKGKNALKAMADRHLNITSASSSSSTSDMHHPDEDIMALPEVTDDLIACSHALQESIIRLLDSSKASINQQYLTSGFSSTTQDSTAMIERQRRDACFSQALTALCTGFVAFIDRSCRHVRQSCILGDGVGVDNESWSVRNWLFWDCLFSVGYLAGFESLLSVFGDERHMLNDMKNAITQLYQSVKFQLHDISVIKQAVKISGSRQDLVISLGILPDIYQDIPSENRDKSIEIHCVLFSRGINEQQIIARWTRDVELESSINQKSMRNLKIVIDKWKKWMRERTHGIGNAGLLIWPTQLVSMIDELVAELSLIVSSSANSVSSLFDGNLLNGVKCRWNDTTVLLISSKIIRLLATCFPSSVINDGTTSIVSGRSSGNKLSFYPTPPFASRFTSCKSAKDRTGMSVTLEQVLFVSFDYPFYKPCNKSNGMESNSKVGLFQSKDRSNSTWTMADYGTSNGWKSTSCSIFGGEPPVFCIHNSAFYKLLNAMRGEEGVRMRVVELNLGLAQFADKSSSTSGNDENEKSKNSRPTTPTKSPKSKVLKSPGSPSETKSHSEQQGKYAFHPLQVSTLPHLYRPPMRCVQAGIST